MTISEDAYKRGLYPKTMDKEGWEEHCLDQKVWEAVVGEVSEEAAAKARMTLCELAEEQQQQLVDCLVEHGVDGFSRAAELLGLRSAKATVTAYLKIADVARFLKTESQQPALPEASIYNPSDMYLRFCDMLVSFAKAPCPPVVKKRSHKAQSKLAHQLL